MGRLNIAFVLAITTACLGEENGELSLESLEILPSRVELRSDGVTRPQQRFRVEGILEGGQRVDLTAEVSFTLGNPALGAMSGPVFTSAGVAGSSVLEATLRGFAVQATIQVSLPEDPDTDIAGPLPADPDAVVDGARADSSVRRPDIIYPADQTMVPRNMPAMEIQWRHHLPDLNGNPRYTEYDYNFRCDELPVAECRGNGNGGNDCESSRADGGRLAILPRRWERTEIPDPANPQEFFPHTGYSSYPRVYRTTVSVPATGNYQFQVQHRDSVQLDIGGRSVLRRQGRTGLRTTNGAIQLTAGEHTLVLIQALCWPRYDRGENRPETYDKPAVNRPPRHELKVMWNRPSEDPTFVVPATPVVYSEYARNGPMPTTEEEMADLALNSWSGTRSQPGGLGSRRGRILYGNFGALVAGSYRFALRNKNHARLYINGQLVVDNGGEHGHQTREGTIELTRGSHSFRLVQFTSSYTGTTLSWAPPGTDLQTMTSLDLGTPDRDFILPNPQLYQVRIQGAEVDITAHTRCRLVPGGGFSYCYYEPPPGVWNLIAESEAGRSSAVEISVTRVDETDEVKTTSRPTELFFSQAQVNGAVYYWDTSQMGIMRTTFGATTDPEYFWPKPQGTKCGGCHALAPRGDRLAVGIVPGVRQEIRTDFDVVDIASDSTLFNNQDGVSSDARQRGSFFAWHPEGQLLVSTLDGDDLLRIRSADSGESVATLGAGLRSTHPDWAPDGRRIAFVDYDGGNSAHPERGRVMITEDQGGAWTAPLQIAPRISGVTYTSPSFAPTSDFLVVARSRCSNGRDGGADCDGYLDPPGRIYAVRTNGSDPIDLERMNARGYTDRSDGRLRYSYPKFSPFIDAARRDGSGRVTWVMFSARRRFGARSVGQKNTLLWMAAIDPDAIARGEDGSFAPFVFPNQILSRSNLHAFWARELVGSPNPPTTPGGPSSCLAEGEACFETGTPCCTDLRCEMGTGTRTTCQAPF